ncbi:hypothetical protein ACP70R_007259 [Stipagrostis hirtigluma subsp. patula]
MSGGAGFSSAAIGVSAVNNISKLFKILLLSITTSFVAEDVSRQESSQYTLGATQMCLRDIRDCRIYKLIFCAHTLKRDVCSVYLTDWDGELGLGGFCTRKNQTTIWAIVKKMLMSGAVAKLQD